MVTIDKTPISSPAFDDAAVRAFQDTLRGQLIRPGDPDYETARKVHNGMIDKHPALIARCVDVADVITSVNFAREHDLLLAIRGGGHNGPGLGTCDNGLVIDLSPMKGIRVDPVARTARVEGGCTLGDVDHATYPFGLAVPTGVNSTTGIAGLTLGGGMGNLTRAYGLTIDNLLEVDMVLAEGTLRDRQLRAASRSLLGHPGWRRQFRRGDILPLPPAPGRERLRRTNAVAPGPDGGRAALVQRLPA